MKMDAEIACGLPVNSLNSKTRKRQIVLARQVVLYLLRKNTSLSFSKIGEYFGADNWIPDHATIIYAISQVQKAIDDPQFDMELFQTYKLIEKQISGDTD